jgi:uncharacterized C2H2 Zn-finger protein
MESEPGVSPVIYPVDKIYNDPKGCFPPPPLIVPSQPIFIPSSPTKSVRSDGHMAISPISADVFFPSTVASPAEIISNSTLHPDGSYTCVCGKNYNNYVSLRNHVKLHGPRERSFICEICHKGFLRRQDLKRHKGTHLQGESPFRCESCGTTFTRSDALSRHVKARRCMHLNIDCDTNK